LSIKKLSIFVGILIILVGTLFFINRAQTTVYGKPASQLNPSTREILGDPNYRNILLPKELERKLANKESFFVYYFASNCPYCRATTPLVKPLADELGVNLHMFNLLEFPEYMNKQGIEATPTTVFYRDGVRVDYLQGGVVDSGTGHTLDDYRAFFEKYKAEADG
jgi:thiol-disulfide isomerase/thioredoxin